MRVLITLSGYEDYTLFYIDDLNTEEVKLLQRIAQLSKEKSDGIDMPIMEVAIEDEKET